MGQTSARNRVRAGGRKEGSRILTLLLLCIHQPCLFFSTQLASELRGGLCARSSLTQVVAVPMDKDWPRASLFSCCARVGC